MLNILLTELSRSVRENLDLGRVYRPHCVRSVLTTSVKILPYRPPARLIRAKYFYSFVFFWLAPRVYLVLTLYLILTFFLSFSFFFIFHFSWLALWLAWLAPWLAPCLAWLACLAPCLAWLALWLAWLAGSHISKTRRSLTRADEKGSGDNDIGLGYRRRSSVSSSLKSYKTDTPKYYR